MRLRSLAWLVLASLIPAAPCVAQQVSAPAAARGASYAQLPLTFEANHGQTDHRVNFVSRGKGYTAYLTAGGVVLSLRSNQVAGPSQDAKHAAAVSRKSARNAVVQLNLVGANKKPIAIGEDPLPGRVNYFIGNNPAKWHKNVPTYGRVRYKNVYAGIDLLYYGNHHQLEYDFAVSAGSDPSQIQFEIQGASAMQLDDTGNLILQVGKSELHFQTPVVYQENNGQRVAVAGGYAVNDATHISFHVADYDRSKPLVIDPVLVYSTYLGGSGNDTPAGIAVDGSGNIYIAGYTNSLDFPLATIGALASGSDHVFVAKLDPTGSNLIYADYIGGSGSENGYALALDSSKNVWVAGSTDSSDFPMVNAFQGTYPGSFNGFVSQLSADGSSLLYSTYLGGNGSDEPASLAVDSAGEIIVAGNTTSTNFPTANAYQSTALANQGNVFGNYGFLTKFNSTGSALVYSTYLAGNTNVADNCNGSQCWPSPFSAIIGVAVDASGNAYAGGSTNTYNFPVTSGAFQTTNTTSQNAEVGFVSKFSTSGSLSYSTYFYGTSGLLTTVSAIAADADGSAYITGAAFSDGTFPITATGICDPEVYSVACSFAFVTKFDAAGDSLIYSTFLGPNNFANPEALALDSNKNAYVLASASAAGLDLVNGIEPYTSGNDLMLVEIDPTASTELFATFLGGSSDENPASLAVDASGNMYVAGSTDSSDFPVTQGAFQTALGGATNAFVAKISPASGAAVAVNPFSVAFTSQNVSTTSSAQTITLRDMGDTALSISSITTTGDFAETDNCGSSVAAASSCSFSVTFTPTAGGNRTGSITIQDNAAGSPHVIALSGTGVVPAPIVGLSPTSLSFGSLIIGTPSPSQSVTLSNTGNATLAISSIQSSGDFGQTNDCGSSVAAGQSCSINVVFTPTAAGSRTGTLTVTDNAQSSPQTVTLVGTGISSTPGASLSPTSLTFLGTPVGVSATAQPVTLSNSGTAALTIGNILASGDFSQTNNCGSSVAAGQSCTINVVFKPTATGSRTGTLTVTDNAQSSPQTASLTGTGVDFSVSAAPTSASVKAGNAGTYTLTIASVGGTFSGAVKLACGTLPSKTSCGFSSSSVTPGATSITSTLTIGTTATTSDLTMPLPKHDAPVYAIWMQLQGLGVFGLVLAGSGKRSRRISILVLLAILVCGVLFMSGCAGGTGIGSTPGTPSGTYTVTITGTSGNLQHSVPVTLTVQ